MQFRILNLLAFLLLAATAVHAQKGAISGTVYDEDGFPMLGANVVIQGSTIGAQTDFIEGKYQFQVDPGTYTLVATYVGYGEQLVSDVTVVANETTVIDVTFGEDSGVELDLDVTVTAQALERGEVAVMKLRQNSDKVQDVISSQEIQRLGAGTAAAALTKVTGTTIVEGKYVYVRGLGDRYSATTMNGLQIPSIDPYRNSAQLDLIPSNILDNIVASKTFTPDLPGDFTGGSVNIKIKALPERFTWGLSLSGAYNGQSNFRNDFLTYEGGSLIAAGYNDGTLDRPDILNDPRVGEYQALSNTVDRTARRDPAVAQAVEDIANAFGNGFTQRQKSTGPDYSFSGSIGNQFNFGTVPVGVFASVSYSRDFSQYKNGVQGNYFNPGGDATSLQELYDLNDNQSIESGKVGGMFGLTVRPSSANNISFYTLYSHQGFLEGRVLQGSNENQAAAGTETDYYASQASTFLERELIDYILQGEHTLTGLGNVKIDWTASYVDSEQNEPDLRFTEYVYDAGIYQIARSRFTLPSRYWRDLSDNTYQGKLDFTVPILQRQSRGNAIKFGGAYRKVDRDFDENVFVYDRAGGISLTEANGDFSQYFGPGNLGYLGEAAGDRNDIGVFVYDNSNLANNYEGSYSVGGAYAMLTYEVTPALKAIVGLRAEQTDILVQSDIAFNELSKPVEDQDARRIDDNTADIDTVNLMPAVNLILKTGENANLRASFSQTVARPNMREVAPFGAFGFLGEPPVFGNPDLVLTSIDNYDLRFEIFPNAGEVLAVSAFYKRFRNPIVTTFRLSGEQQFTWTNSESANLYGLELEARKDLAFLGEKLANFTVSANLTLLESQQLIDDREYEISQNIDPNASQERPFNGQSPFVANANLNYVSPNTGWEGLVAFNFFGDRLQGIGAVGSPDVYERGRGQLDVSLSKGIENFKFTLRARNLLNPAYQSFSTFQGTEYMYRSFERGREFSFGISYGI